MFQKTTFELKNPNALGTGSSYFGFNFGCAKEPVDGKIELVNSYHSCREGLMSNMRDRIMKGASAQPTDKTRMIFRWSASNQKASQKEKDLEAIDGWVKRSVPVIRAFDQLAGWPLTRVYKINVKYDWLIAYYFHSSRRWMKSSYLISLYVLLVRMCKDERITGFKNFEGLVKVVNGIIEGPGPTLKTDHRYVKDSMPYWEAIMKGYPRLFRKRKMPYYWDTDRIGGAGGGYEGIQYLVRGDTSYKEVRKELLKIKKELDAKSK